MSPDHIGIVAFSLVAIRDLDFWRSLARCALVYPNLFGTKLENLEFGRQPTWFVWTDASTGHGGGGWISRTGKWVPGALEQKCFALRWTSDERRNISTWLNTIPCLNTVEDLKVLQANLHHYCSAAMVRNITMDMFLPCLSGTVPSLDLNGLEFATAVFAVMWWAPMIQGCCICLGADNTATLCWLVKHKTTNVASDTLLKLLALTCAVYNIQVVTEFIPGVCNVLADWLSRVSAGGNGKLLVRPQDCALVHKINFVNIWARWLVSQVILVVGL